MSLDLEEEGGRQGVAGNGHQVEVNSTGKGPAVPSRWDGGRGSRTGASKGEVGGREEEGAEDGVRVAPRPGHLLPMAQLVGRGLRALVGTRTLPGGRALSLAFAQAGGRVVGRESTAEGKFRGPGAGRGHRPPEEVPLPSTVPYMTRSTLGKKGSRGGTPLRSVRSGLRGRGSWAGSAVGGGAGTAPRSGGRGAELGCGRRDQVSGRGGGAERRPGGASGPLVCARC